MSDFSVDTLTVEQTLNAPTSATTSAEISSAVSAHSSLTNNPHATTKAQVGLANVDNTSDASKPISTATQTALNLKYDASNPNSYQTAAQVTASIQAVVAAAPAALDTLNEIAAALGNDANFATTITNNLALKAPIASPTFTGTVSGITKAMVGLGNADNTSDANKPISTAAQTALNLKSNLAGGNTFTGNQNFGAAPVNIPQAPLNLVNSAGGTLLTQLNLVNGGGGGGAGSAIDFHTYDVGGGTTPGARIGAIDDNFSAFLAFYTKIPGAATNGIIERMRISNTGDVTIGLPLGSILTNNPLSVNGTVNGFLQSNVQNTSTGANASADIIATADNGTDTNNFIDMGVNNSAYADPSFTINGPNDGYLYVQGGDLSVGTGAANKIVFFTGGTLAANEVARITPAGQFALGVTAPNAASKFQIDSTTQGFLPPRMTSAQRLAIATPPAGLSVYDTNLNTLCIYSGTTWGFETNYNTTAIQTSTSTTYANITEWVTASLEPGLYALRLRGIGQSTAGTTGFGLRLQNATATVNAVAINWTFNQAAAGTDKDYEYQQIALGDNVTSTGVVAANTDFTVHGDGVFRVSVAGTVAIQIRTEVNASGVSIRPNSTLILKRVGV